ncbi:dTMP kinase [Mycoplasmatota bacterium]|nr:dTMP kinase [Mycoplasmatota bacterium]
MFITFEGGEGSGKTSLIKYITNALSTYDIVSTREPGGSMVAEAIRDVVLNPKYEGVTPYTEALLYAASRAQHLDEVVIPAIKANKLVLCDRYIDSSLAYQGYARDLGFDFVLSINQYALFHMPDLTFYIDIDPKLGLSRINHRQDLDRLDQESINFHDRVRQGYNKVLETYPNRVVRIDGDRTIEEIANEIITIIKERL